MTPNATFAPLIADAERIRDDVAKLCEAVATVYNVTPTMDSAELDAWMDSTGCRRLQRILGEIQDLPERV